MNDAFPEESMLQMFHSICNTEATPLKSPPPRRERPMGAEVFLAEESKQPDSIFESGHFNLWLISE